MLQSVQVTTHANHSISKAVLVVQNPKDSFQKWGTGLGFSITSGSHSLPQKHPLSIPAQGSFTIHYKANLNRIIQLPKSMLLVHINDKAFLILKGVHCIMDNTRTPSSGTKQEYENLSDWGGLKSQEWQELHIGTKWRLCWGIENLFPQSIAFGWLWADL